MSNYILATIKDWNIKAFEAVKEDLPGLWHLVTDHENLTLDFIKTIKPRYIFFPHWSWIVPQEILDAAECVCFHMTDVPYGRGGSPLQNLIARGHKDTKLTALRMAEELDAGPVYMKKPLSLEGRAQDIFERTAPVTMQMIKEIVMKEPTPAPQKGEVTIFKRRTPEMSVFPESGGLDEIYDHIRMLDADTYPPAFLEYGDFILTFKDAEFSGKDALRACVEIRKKKA